MVRDYLFCVPDLSYLAPALCFLGMMGRKRDHIVLPDCAASPLPVVVPFVVAAPLTMVAEAAPAGGVVDGRLRNPPKKAPIASWSSMAMTLETSR